MSLSLNCLLDGDSPDRIFTVEIPTHKSVSILKDLIKEKNSSSLGNVDPKDIDLWQVSLPIDNLETEIDPSGYTKLSPPVKKLSTFFADVADDYLH
ncbi:hypothetical protein CVT25_007870, partial [Psilocybe cyanescens]